MVRQVRDEFKIVKQHWRNYVFQSLLATASLFCVLVFLEQGSEVIVASLGATAFVVFALPNNLTAQPRNVIGGHIVGLVCGSAGYLLLSILPNPEQFVAEAGFHAFAVGLSIFIMVITNTEHPPAAGTALGAVFGGPGERLIISVLFFSIVFSGIRLLLRKHLRDLA
ncbi:MAG: HPP family protein [Planctomycetota bacterium]|nr:MAG: HPP family protein [Planctomycetota bacterium]